MKPCGHDRAQAHPFGAKQFVVTAVADKQGMRRFHAQRLTACR
jgi:hypothetical protein